MEDDTKDMEATINGESNDDRTADHINSDKSHPRTGDGASLERYLLEIWQGRQLLVEIKRTIPKGAIGFKDFKTKKIFVGGIPTTVTEDEFKDFFSKFGEVKEHQIMRDHSSSRSRGFGFISFDTEQAVDDILADGNRVEFAGAQVEIKKAEPKKPNPPPPPSKRHSNSKPAFGGGYEDAYGGYGRGIWWRQFWRLQRRALLRVFRPLQWRLW